MFTLSAVEKEMLSKIESLQNEITLGMKATSVFGSIPNYSLEAKKTQLKAMLDSPIAIRALLKQGFNDELAKVAGGSLGQLKFEDILDSAEALIQSLDSDGSQRVAGIIRSVYIKFLQAQANPELQRAKAELLQARFLALTNSGFSEDFAGNIILAELGKSTF